MSIIDTNLNFADDTKDYWNNFWENNNGYGSSNIDPDTNNQKLQKYHQILWSKQLPNGEYMDLQPSQDSYGTNILLWKDFVLSSDSLINGFRWPTMKSLIDELKVELPNYQQFQEEYIRKAYTIGGMIVFPRHRNSINQRRGCSRFIKDRVDLTIECIRLYYEGKENPLSYVLKSDEKFFNLFNDFKGYINYFYLQDIVSEDYKKVNIYIGSGNLKDSPLPQNTKEWFIWHDKTIDFLKKRNARIAQAMS